MTHFLRATVALPCCFQILWDETTANSIVLRQRQAIVGRLWCTARLIKTMSPGLAAIISLAGKCWKVLRDTVSEVRWPITISDVFTTHLRGFELHLEFFQVQCSVLGIFSALRSIETTITLLWQKYLSQIFPYFFIMKMSWNCVFSSVIVNTVCITGNNLTLSLWSV